MLNRQLIEAERHNDAITFLSALLEGRTGQQLAANRIWRVETALKPLLRSRGLNTLDQLVAQIGVSGNDPLTDAVVDALLNQETSFYRDTGAIELAADIVLTAGRARRARIWSAACSTGQEPLSLAMIFAEHCAASGQAEPDIVATDVSEAAIARAKTGLFTQFEIQRGLPVRRMIDWFEPQGNDWAAVQPLLRRISFRRHNLVTDPPPAGMFDLILCRNVLLYLSVDVRRDVFNLLASALRPDGLLMLGAGETVIGQTERFVPSQRHKGLYALTGGEG